MQSMNISLPDPLKQFVETLIGTGRYSSASEYVRELIREDEKKRAQERLETLLLAGLEGEETALDKTEWQTLRQEAVAQLRARNPSN